MIEEWFSELAKAYSLLPDYESAYSLLGRLYRRVLDERTWDSDIQLVGCFAKTDYLLKDKNASSELKFMVHSMRMRVTNNDKVWRQEDFPYDFQALSLFISFLFSTPIPDFIRVGFPKKLRNSTAQKVCGDYMRVIVDTWDDDCLYCESEDTGGLVTVAYREKALLSEFDYSYVAQIVKRGMMLNLIRPRRDKQGVLYPEHIIVDPDYLVDVSTIASCFESYAESPVVSVLSRLLPPVVNEQILVGNLASELLDATLHLPIDEEFTLENQQALYKNAVRKFFRNNALGVMSVCPSKEFHNQAWNQMHNIHQAVNKVLPHQVVSYNSHNVVVEPTFFSEMLGLQGRMDMLQADFRVLVEQKAGNASYASARSNADTPYYRDQHYMQMLLYMAIIRYNYRSCYEDNNHELHAFLLYSKYKRPLVGLGFAPGLLYKALRLRNLYVVQEDALCRGGLEALMEQTPDDFNEKQARGILWERYQRPRIEKVLTSFQSASELERRYFARFYRFVALEHRMSKVGGMSKECSGFASAWLSSLEEKLQCGNIIINMTMQPCPKDDSVKLDSVRFLFDGDAGNFRDGDIVVLHSYTIGHAPDLRRTIVHRAIISKIEPDVLTLRLRNPQHDASVFVNKPDVRWCIEHDFMESSYNGLYKGLYFLLSATRERKDLVLMQRRPKVVKSAKLLGDYGRFNILQQRVKDAKELFLIIGPPGTGKTSFGLLNTLQEELLERDSRILLVAYTNRAVDEICSKLTGIVDFVRFGGYSCASGLYKEKYFESIVDECSSYLQISDRISQTRVFVGTTSSITTHLSLISRYRISLCIVDEASQILEPHLLPLLTLSCQDGLPCISKFVMIGDHKQLPAVVQQSARESFVDDPLLNDICLDDCRKSLFERFLSRYGADEELCYMLSHQGRMHRDIAHFPNVAFYEGKLQEVPLEHQLSPSPEPRLRFVDIPCPEDSGSDKVNLSEASFIASELFAIWGRTRDVFNPQETVGVIVPYRSQISAIRKMLADKLRQPDHPLLQITIDTVERFQGSQRRYIIYGLTVQKHYQLRFLSESAFEENGRIIDRKLNVAMTRAQEYLIIVGNALLLSRIPVYANLIHYINNRGNIATT